MPLDAQMQRPQAAQHEEAVERPGHRAHRVLQEAQPLRDLVVDGHGDAQDRVGVPGKVLRRRVEDDVGAERRAAAGGRATRTCCRRRSAAAARPRAARRRTVAATAAMSTTLSSGFVGVSNQTRRVRSVSASQSSSVPDARSTYARSPRPGPVDPLEVAERAAVDVVADDDLLARTGELGDRRGRRGARREGDPVPPALERRDGPLEALAGRVLRPRVLVAAARPADPVLRVRRGLVDRRRRPRPSARRARRRHGRRACRTTARSSGLAVVAVHASAISRPLSLGGQSVELEDELRAVDVVHLDCPTWRKPNFGSTACETRVVGRRSTPGSG